MVDPDRLVELAARAGEAVTRAFLVMDKLSPREQSRVEKLVTDIMATGVRVKVLILGGLLKDEDVGRLETLVSQLEELLEKVGGDGDDDSG